jgi:hypothetical protein
MSKDWSKRTPGHIRLHQSTWDHVTPTPSTIYSDKLWLDKADGFTNPHWKDQIARSEQAGTPFVGTRIRVEHTDGAIHAQGYSKFDHTPTGRRESHAEGCLVFNDYTSLGTVQASSSKAESIACSKFYAAASDALAALQGGELVGELHKTASEITRTCMELTKLLLDWRRELNKIRSSSWRQVAGRVSDTYLRWKFGWDPLVKDVRSLMHGMVNDMEMIVPVYAKGEDSQQVGPPGQSESTLGLMNFTCTVKDVQKNLCSYLGGIKCMRPGIGGFAERLGLSPSNFLPTAYNLLPWTYMMDYFSNLGDIVSSIGFPRTSIAWCVQTRKFERILTFTAGASPKPLVNLDWDPGYPIVVPSTTTWIFRRVERDLVLPPSTPPLYLKVPDFQTEGGRVRGLNIAAVLAARTWGEGVASSRGWGG